MSTWAGREWKVGVEYDGEQHWTDPAIHAGDIERLEYLAAQELDYRSGQRTPTAT